MVPRLLRPTSHYQVSSKENVAAAKFFSSVESTQKTNDCGDKKPIFDSFRTLNGHRQGKRLGKNAAADMARKRMPEFLSSEGGISSSF